MIVDYQEKIADLEGKIEQLKNRQRRLAQKYKAEKRKVRTKRLIERGAILESIIEAAEDMTNEQVKSLLEKALRGQSGTRNISDPKPTPATQDSEKSSD